MTHPIIEGPGGETQPRVEGFLDWFHINSRLVAIGATVVGIGVFGMWIVQRTSMNQTLNSDKQLLQAKQSLASGNAPLAEADLKKVMDKYTSKAAGAEAGMLLAQIKMERGDFKGAADGLAPLAEKVKDGPNAASIRGLHSDALAQQDKPAEAAAGYEQAAALSSMGNERAFWLAKAGRAYMVAGNTAKAKAIFEGLSTSTDNQAVATEARVRLGELSVSGTP